MSDRDDVIDVNAVVELLDEVYEASFYVRSICVVLEMPDGEILVRTIEAPGARAARQLAYLRDCSDDDLFNA